MSLPVDQPNTNAWLRTTEDAESVLVGTTTARFVAVGNDTEERYGLFRWDMSGTPGGATPHYHRTFSEAFYVVEGRMSLFDGTEWRPGGAGDFLYVPPGGIHGFRNESAAPASMLILFAPAPPRETYFRELAERIASGRQFTPQETTEFLARHDQYEP